MVMREIEETSYNYSCFRPKKTKKREFKTKRAKKREKKRELRWYEIGIQEQTEINRFGEKTERRI